MTTGEKAKELVDRFYDTIENNVELYKGEYLVTAKQCALICIDEMIKEHIHVSQNYKWQDEIWEWLREVKQEINKL